MAIKWVLAGLIVIGVTLTIGPPIYLYEATYLAKKPVANTTFTLNSEGGVLFSFHGGKGNIITIVVSNNAKSKGNVLVIRMKGPTIPSIILQDKIEENNQKAYKIALPVTGDYSLYLLNPVNSSTTGYIVAVLEKKSPLSQSPEASTILLISIIGGIILGYASGYKPSYKPEAETN